MKRFTEWLTIREDGDLNASSAIVGPDEDGQDHIYHPPKPPLNPSMESGKIDKLFKGGDMSNQGAGVLFTDGKCVLLLKRSSKSKNPDTWGLPGGHAKKNEKSFETASRECEEEIGITPHGIRVGKVDEANGWIVYIYRVDRPFDVRLNSEHSEYAWIKWIDLGDYKLHPFFERNIEQYKKMLNI